MRFSLLAGGPIDMYERGVLERWNDRWCGVLVSLILVPSRRCSRINVLSLLEGNMGLMSTASGKDIRLRAYMRARVDLGRRRDRALRFTAGRSATRDSDEKSPGWRTMAHPILNRNSTVMLQSYCEGGMGG